MDFHSGKTWKSILILMCGAVQAEMPLALMVITCVSPPTLGEYVPSFASTMTAHLDAKNSWGFSPSDGRDRGGLEHGSEHHSPKACHSSPPKFLSRYQKSWRRWELPLEHPGNVYTTASQFSVIWWGGYYIGSMFSQTKLILLWSDNN